MDQSGQGRTYKAARLWDQAIDWDHSECVDAVLYARERDFSALRFRDGKKPVVFEYRHLTRRDMRDLESTCTSASERRERAFALGIVRVEWPSGELLRSEKRLSDGELDRFEYCDVEEIGELIYQRARLPLELGPSYVPPPSSVDAWARSRSLYAAQSPTKLDPSNEKPVQQSPEAIAESVL